MYSEQAEKEFEEWEEKCTCSLGWNSEGKRCVIRFDKNCPFHYPDSELAKLKEAHSRQQEKIEGLRDRADLVEAEAKVEELEGSFNRLTLDLIEAKRNHALELAERLKVEEKMKELEYQLRDDTGRIITMLRGRVEQAEARVKELETENNDILGELERAADKHLRNLWKLGEGEAKVKELEKAIQVHEDLELRLAEGKHKNWLDWKQAEAKIKELEEEANRQEKVFMEVVNKKEEFGEKLLQTESRIKELVEEVEG